MREISSVFKIFLEAGEQQITRLAGQLMANEAFMSRLQGTLTKAMDAKLVWDNQMRAALARLGVPSQEELEGLRNEVNELRSELQRLRQQAETPDSESAAPKLRSKPSLALAPEQPEKHYSKVSAG
ncbi:MAG: phasin family protein [Cystobacterineae bacterium]|nr:phasin family protein [Cystobacterineae bacterium]